MAGKFGYAEIRKVAFFGVELGNATYESAHAATGIGRVASFLAVADEALALLTIDRAELKAEWDELDDDDWAKLVADCKAKFKLKDAAGLEDKIEASVDCGFKALEAVAAAVGVWKAVP